MSPQIHLASRSPRRAELLRRLGLRFVLIDVDVTEQPAPGQRPADYARATALAKARAGRAALLRNSGAAPLAPVLGADTDVSIDGEILGKPRDADDGVRMLLRLAGRSHEVCSAVALIGADAEDLCLSVTRVEFGPITRAEALAYWRTGEPADKAGAYAIQGLAGRWVRAVEGSFSGVVGLPLAETAQLLRAHGVALDPARVAAAEAALREPAGALA